MPVTAIVRAVVRTGLSEIETVIDAQGADHCSPSQLDAVFNEIEANARRQATLGRSAATYAREGQAVIARSPNPMDALPLVCSHAAPLVAPVPQASGGRVPSDSGPGEPISNAATARWRDGEADAIRVASSRARRDHRRVLN